MRRVGDQRAVGVEHRAGEIEPLLDVDAGRGRLQRDAHFLGDGHEQVVENLEPDRDRRRCRSPSARSSGTARVRTSVPSLARSARQPGSTTMVEVGSKISAGPFDEASPRVVAARSISSALRSPARCGGIVRSPPRPAHRRSLRRPRPNSRSAAGEGRRTPARICSAGAIAISSVVSLPAVRSRARRWSSMRSACDALLDQRLAGALLQLAQRSEKSSPSGFSQLVSRIAFTSAMPMP